MPTKHAKQTSQDRVKLASKAWTWQGWPENKHAKESTGQENKTCKQGCFYTHIAAVTQKHLLDRNPSAHTPFYTQTLSHTNPFTKHFYTQKLLHTNTFIQTHFYTQTLLHTNIFTQKHSYTQTFYTETLLHTKTFTHRHFYTNAFTHKHFYTQTSLHRHTLTHKPVYTETLLHTETFTQMLRGT